MHDEPDPPRKYYGFKPTDFDRVNPSAPGAKPPGESPAPCPMPAAATGPIEVHDLYRHANAGAGGTAMPKSLSGVPLPGASRPAAGENDVHALLRHNLACEKAAGAGELAPKPPRKSRRKRDYFVVLAAGNLVIVFAGASRGFNLGVLAVDAIGVGFFTGGLTWLTWFVMDDY